MPNIDYKQVKADLSFSAVLSHYQLNDTNGRDQITIPCPFHGDKTASCSINKVRGMFRCFGCDLSGNILDFICYSTGGDKTEAEDIKAAAHYAVTDILGKSPEDYAYRGRGTRSQAKQGSSNPKPSSIGQDRKSRSEARPAPPETIEDEKSQEVKFNKPLSFGALKNLQTDHVFFTNRGLSAKTVETFGLGYCKTGIMAGRIAIPIHNSDNEIVAYSGRWPEGDPPEGEGKYKLPKGFNKSIELYNQVRAKALLDELGDDAPPLVVVEGYWSVMRLHNEQIPVVATFGSDLSEEQALIIASMETDVIIVYDGDEPGRAGARKAAGALAPYAYVRILDLADTIKPDTMDLNDLEELF